MSDKNEVRLWKRIVQGILIFIVPIIVVLPSLPYIRYNPEAIIAQYCGALLAAWFVTNLWIKRTTKK